MAQFDSRYTQATTVGRAGVDEGLRAYMLGVYNYMAAGVALTGIVAYLVFSMAVTNDAASAAATLPNGKMLTSFGVAIFTTPLRWVLFLAPLAFVFFLSFKIESISATAAQTTFWLFCAVMGLSLAAIFLVFTGTSIARTFFIAAAMFGATSLYGYTTRRDLAQFGSFLMMGLIGIIIASLVNIFLASAAVHFAHSDLSGLALFEEACDRGVTAAEAALARLRAPAGATG